MPTSKRMGLQSAEDLLRRLRWGMVQMEREIGDEEANRTAVVTTIILKCC